ncbi:enoyl-CoA hydratase-related protein [Iodidimonas sp. SYSU 1G8]|uniref:enoyl-CoA hydratase-related protein n=1 Tax=Iodidimonas sp. SYSU 1G8 TaxID=3133967 RepID=UPI0031FE9905
MNDTDHVLYEVTDRVATLTLNRPDKMNAWGPDMEVAFRAAIERAAADEGARAIVVTGAGKGFCAGADLSPGPDGKPRPRITPPFSADDFGQRYSYLLGVPKPIIAAINGACAGVGLCLALYADMRYMAEGAKMTTAFVRRGLIAEHGSAWMLPRLIGSMNAMDLLLTGRTIDAAEAQSMGLVKMLPREGFAGAVHAVAADMAESVSPRAMAIIKRQVWMSYSQSLAAATQMSNEEQAKCFGTEDFKEGVAHFLERRKPNFTGR